MFFASALETTKRFSRGQFLVLESPPIFEGLKLSAFWNEAAGLLRGHVPSFPPPRTGNPREGDVFCSAALRPFLPRSWVTSPRVHPTGPCQGPLHAVHPAGPGSGSAQPPRLREHLLLLVCVGIWFASRLPRPSQGSRGCLIQPHVFHRGIRGPAKT